MIQPLIVYFNADPMNISAKIMFILILDFRLDVRDCMFFVDIYDKAMWVIHYQNWMIAPTSKLNSFLTIVAVQSQENNVNT